MAPANEWKEAYSTHQNVVCARLKFSDYETTAFIGISNRGFGTVGDLRITCAPSTPDPEVESRTTPAKAASFRPVESLLTESCEKTGIPIVSPFLGWDVTHPAAANKTSIVTNVVRKGASIGDFTRKTKGVSLSNALVQLQAYYNHCGEAASEKCLSAATFVRQRDHRLVF